MTFARDLATLCAFVLGTMDCRSECCVRLALGVRLKSFVHLLASLLVGASAVRVCTEKGSIMQTFSEVLQGDGAVLNSRSTLMSGRNVTNGMQWKADVYAIRASVVLRLLRKFCIAEIW